jgi:hypothetical protein
MKPMRPFALALLLVAALAATARAQQAPQCASERDESSMIETIFEVFTGEYWAAERAKVGIAPQSASVPHGLLSDNSACVRLRKAARKQLAAQAPELDAREVDARYDLSFFSMGNYYAVLGRVRVDPSSNAIVRQRMPMFIFTKDKKPRFLMDVYM